MQYKILESFEGEFPCGKDSKYENSFLLIEDEIDKNNSVTQEGTTDWKLVEESCVEFLISQSKDMKIVSWFVYSSWRNSSYDGLMQSLLIYHDLLNKFSKEIHPKSKKARINIYNWLEEKLTSDIRDNVNNKNIVNYKKDLLEVFDDINSLISLQLGKEGNYFNKIKIFLNSLNEEKKINEIETITNEKTHKEKDLKSTIKRKDEPNIEVKQEKEISEITNDREAIQVLRKFKKYSSLLTDYFRKNDISDLKALRITRLLSSLDIDGLPASNNNKSLLYPPSELEIDKVKSLYHKNEYKEAFYLTEEIIEVSPFWIDGYYYSYNILEKTKNFKEANEVKYLLLCFLKTNEGILELSFNDGTGFASSKTKKWIKENILTINEDKEEKTTIEEDDEKSKILKDVNSLINDNKIKDAMNLINKKYLTSSTTEEKFKWRLYHAEVAVEFDKKDIALALLEDLQKDISRFYLNEWNPKLAAKVYILLLTSFSNIEIENEKLESIYKNLCKTDINSAYEIKIN